jgi:hypothetical protein
MARRWTAAVAALALAGCGGAPGEAAPAPSVATTTTAPTASTGPAPVGGLLAEIGTNRLYGIDHALGLRLRNVGAEPVAVAEVQLESPMFSSQPPGPAIVQLQAGGRAFTVPLPYGEPRCGDDVAPVLGALVVLDDGTELHVPAVEEYAGAVERLHDRECAAAAVLEAVDITWSDEWARVGEHEISGQLVLEQRVPGPAVELEELRGSVMFAPHPDPVGPPIVRVTDDEPRAAVDVVISSARCDPHALAEVKYPFRFLTWAVVGDEAGSIPIQLDVDGPARDALQGLLDACSS